MQYSQLPSLGTFRDSPYIGHMVSVAVQESKIEQSGLISNHALHQENQKRLQFQKIK